MATLKELLAEPKHTDKLSCYDIANITYENLEHNIKNWSGSMNEIVPEVTFDDTISMVRILLYRPNGSYVPIKYSYPTFYKNEQTFNYVVFGVRTLDGEFWIVPYCVTHIYRPTYITSIKKLLLDKIDMANIPSNADNDIHEPEFFSCINTIQALKKVNNFGINIKTLFDNINNNNASDIYYLYRKNNDIWMLHFNKTIWYKPYVFITLSEFEQIEKNGIDFVNSL